MAWRFEPGERLSDAFRRVAAEEIAKVRGALTDPANNRARGVHEARQSFKRLRALLRLARPSHGAVFGEVNARLREAGRRLSGSRDATVLLESLDKIVRACGASLPPDDLDCLRSYLRAGGPHSDGVETDEQLRGVLILLDEIEAQLGSLDWPSEERALANGLKRGQARLRSDWKAARKTGEVKALHGWRKRVKDQSAQLRLFRRVLPASLRARHGDEKKTAELLGEEHDYWMLEERLSAKAAPPQAAVACRVLLRTLASRRKALRRQALKLGARFSSQGPKAFAREIIAAWEKPIRAPEKDAAEEPLTSQAS